MIWRKVSNLMPFPWNFRRQTTGANDRAIKTTRSNGMKLRLIEYAKAGIRANSILPGLMNTPMIVEPLKDAYAEGDVDKMVEMRDAQCPMGHMGDAWDVAHAALFLASDEAKYITATELVVDGGLTAQIG